MGVVLGSSGIIYTSSGIADLLNYKTGTQEDLYFGALTISLGILQGVTGYAVYNNKDD